ncbi:DEAD/DEAH box helicase [Arthrobacter sp. I2-34]|uniref:DEAD/DEAH box helicase n=1 Tax=Arthrobacter hankyongi TaxID=2904801 RepID=A0ABS9L2X3_9MICC|nr:SNF2-related protein [Arthrobacter hankyongi]MCG2620960.1 DEAD/DEAH box helicase [Arthrobacter hankyongi]
MPEQSLPSVDAGEIIRRVGGGAFARGQGYARAASVLELDWDAQAGLLLSRVDGTAAVPYRCRIRLTPEAGHGSYLLADSSCSCPVGSSCKHVAATLLYANVLRLRSAPELQAPAGPAAPDTLDSGAGWQQCLDELLGPAADGPAAPRHRPPGRARSGTRTPLGLQFELRDEPERFRPAGPAKPWHPAAQPRRDRPGHMPRLGVRPVLRNARGRWVKNQLRWNTISYKSYGLDLDPEQHRWFAQFVPLHRATGQLYFGEDNDWLYLEEFSSPLLWQLFEEARRLGIELIGVKQDTTVTVGAAAVLALEARADGPAPGFRLEPVLRIDGQEHPVDSAGAIAWHGLYSCTEDGRRITLAPAAGGLNDVGRRLLLDGTGLDIPAADADSFFERYYPALSRTITVASSDGSVPLPEILPPVLVLAAAYGPANTLELRWEFEYGAGGRITRMPLAPDPGPGGLRDGAAEEQLLAAVRAVPGIGGLAPDPQQPAASLQDLATLDFTRSILPQLEALDGVRVEISGGRPDYRELTEAPELTVSTVESEQTDWFDLGLMVKVAGREIPFGNIFKALSRGQKKLLLVDKTYLSLEQPVFDRLRRLVDEARQLQDRDSGPLRISRYQAGLWEELEELATDTDQAPGWSAAVTGLLELGSTGPATLPTGLQARLRPYQQEGFNWLAFLWRHQLGGILADDMGLGKTLQTLALICHARQCGATGPGGAPFLVVAPTSVVPNWVSEAHRFAPQLQVAAVTETRGLRGRPLAAAAAGADVVVTSYAVFRLDAAAYQEQQWAGLILDEAQFVKNRATKAHQAARALRAPFKLAITGTPLENNLMELWSILAIVAPGLFPSPLKFADQYQRPIERSGSPERLDRLRRRIRPLMMRRTKEAVAPELPSKQEQVLEVELAPRHRKIYDTHLQRERQKILRLVADLDRNRFTIFQSLTLLRLLSLDAGLVDDEYDGVASAKLDVLFDQLQDVLAEGHRALVFSQFTSFLKRAAARLDAAGIPYAYLDGATRNRADVIASFKEGAAPVFLISLKAGGFGLNLTEADYCFLLDPWWNPATEAQAVDRTHRIGQTRNVMVYRLVARGTIEEKVMALKEGKTKLFSSVLDEGTPFSAALTAEDIRGLLDG